MKSTKIYTGLIGSGKTTTKLIPIATELFNNGQNVIIAVPSKLLINEIFTSLQSNGVNVSTINSDECKSRSVLSGIQSHFSNTDTKTQVLIITQQAYRMAAGRIDTSSYVCLWDELPEPSNAITVRFNTNHTSSISITDFISIDNDTLKVTLAKGYKKDTELGMMDQSLAELCAILYNKTADVYAQNVSDEYMSFTIVYKPTLFPSNTIFFGADAETHTFTKVLRNYGVDVEIETVGNGTGNHASDKIEIYYTTSINPSLYMQKNNPTLWEKIVSPIKEAIGDNPSLLLHNDADPLQYGDNFTELSHNSHGLNSYSHHNSIALLSALNISDNVAEIMKNFGLTEEDIFMTRTIGTYYQAIGRTQLRLREEMKDALKIYVTSKHIANTLKNKYFTNATLVELADVQMERVVRVKKDKAPVAIEDRRKISCMRKLAKQNYYSQPINYTLLNSSSREIISQSWYKDYSARGKVK